MGFIVQHLSRIIIPPVVILLLAFAYFYHKNDTDNERAMTKELEYVIEQQAAEIADLKIQLQKANETAKAPVMIEREVLRMEVDRSCPVPLKPEHLPCTIKDPAAIIAIRGYKDETVQSR